MNKNCMDVAFKVVKLRRFKAGYYHVKGQWINLGYTGNPWAISSIETIKVPIRDYEENWVDITNKLKYPRTKPGLPE